MKTFLGLTFTFDQFKEFLQNKNSIIKKKLQTFELIFISLFYLFIYFFAPLKHPASVIPNINLLSTKIKKIKTSKNFIYTISDLKKHRILQNPKTLFPGLNLILSPRFPVRSRMFRLHCIINIQQFPLCTATSQHGHFPNHDLHCSDMKAICWPFRSWTLSLKHTQTCVWVSHTEWSSEGTQWCSTIPWFNSEHMSFQHSHAPITHNLRC